jgi:endoglycosylceramidase
MNWSAIEPRPGVFDQSYLRSIRATVQTLAAHHIYSLLDWHQDDWGLAAAGIDGAPAWATLTDGLPNPPLGYGVGMLGDPAQWRAFDNFWGNAKGPGGIGIADRFAAMLAYYGRAFRNQAYLLGYDIFNEPNAGSQYVTCLTPLGCPVFDHQLSAWYRRVIPMLRSADPGHLILYEPNVFFDFGANTNVQAPADRNTGLAFHSYCLGDGAAGALPDLPNNSSGCAVEEQLELGDALTYGARTGAALIADEWGATNDETTIARQTDEFDASMLPWVFWDYRNLVHDVTGRPSGSNVNRATLGNLDRAYPRAIAGTPLGWSWNAGSRRFALTYSTTLPGGRRGGGRRTEVYVPALHYPSGYVATSTGARIISSPNANPLVLQNDTGAKTVTLTVGPR